MTENKENQNPNINNLVQSYSPTKIHEILNGEDDVSSSAISSPINNDYSERSSTLTDLATGVIESSESLNPTLLELKDDFMEDFLDEIDEVPGTNEDLEEKRVILRNKINAAKRFYYEGFNDQIMLSHSTYVRFKNVKDFIGFPWKSRIDDMKEVELVCQLVNEKNRINYTCNLLFFREAAFRLDYGIRSKLMKKYIGRSNATKFIKNINLEIVENMWFLTIYRKRFSYVKTRVFSILGGNNEFIKLFKNYDDVYDYFIANLDLIK